MFSSADSAVPLIILGTAFLQFLLMAAAAFVGSAAALTWHGRWKTKGRRSPTN
jgi:hypothetical protein